MTCSIAHAVAGQGAAWDALVVFQVALTIVVAWIAARQAEFAVRRGRECELLRAECDRLRPLAEVTELQTQVSRALLEVARQPGRNAPMRAEDHFAQWLLVPAETNKESKK
jgi:hypothetical protein